MLAECGLQAGRAPATAWRCDDPGMELVPLAALRVPATRGLGPERLLSRVPQPIFKLL